VKFDPAEDALNTLNVSRRSQGVFELHTKYQAPDDAYRIVWDYVEDPFAVAYLTGTSFPQSFGASLPRKILSDSGRVAADCSIGVPSNPTSSDEEHFGCEVVLSGALDARLARMAKQYLIMAMKN
jgi:hypothetical protein